MFIGIEIIFEGFSWVEFGVDSKKVKSRNIAIIQIEMIGTSAYDRNQGTWNGDKGANCISKFHLEEQDLDEQFRYKGGFTNDFDVSILGKYVDGIVISQCNESRRMRLKKCRD